VRQPHVGQPALAGALDRLLEVAFRVLDAEEVDLRVRGRGEHDEAPLAGADLELDRPVVAEERRQVERPGLRRERQPDLVVAEAPANWLPGSSDAAGYRLHIVDPQGRLIMDYPVDVAAKGVRADLDRLLKFAWTG
jgi:hypothetical protein